MFKENFETSPIMGVRLESEMKKKKKKIVQDNYTLFLIEIKYFLSFSFNYLLFFCNKIISNDFQFEYIYYNPPWLLW